MQQIPWLREAAAWEEVFAAHHANSPDMARAAREWRLLRGRVAQISDFAPGWTNRTPVVRAEMPFFWKMRKDRCLEGIIDLAFFDPIARQWLIVDWKTNRIAGDKLEKLREKYLPQLAAYCQVVKETIGHEARAAIYSTATGEFVRYDPQKIVASASDRARRGGRSPGNTVRQHAAVLARSAAGCSGNPQVITITINPEPVVSSALNATICSDLPSGLVLNTNGTSVAAAIIMLTQSL